jgi:hypothetical protein
MRSWGLALVSPDHADTQRRARVAPHTTAALGEKPPYGLIYPSATERRAPVPLGRFAGRPHSLSLPRLAMVVFKRRP